MEYLYQPSFLLLTLCYKKFYKHLKEKITMGKLKDGRGQNKVEEGKKTKERILSWVNDNPGKTRKECCEALNISHGTLIRHLKKIG